MPAHSSAPALRCLDDCCAERSFILDACLSPQDYSRGPMSRWETMPPTINSVADLYFARFEARLQKGLAEVRSEMDKGFAEVRSEMDTGLSEVRSEAHARLA